MTTDKQVDPLVGLYLQWQAAYAEFEAKCLAHSRVEFGGDTSAVEEVVRQRDAVEECEMALAEQITNTPAATIGGVLAKIHMAEHCLREGIGEPDLAVNAMRDARRMLARVEPDALERAPELPTDTPLIAMCDEWHGINAELQTAYNTVGDLSSESIHKRLAVLTDKIAATVPATVGAFMTQLAIAREWHWMHQGLLPTHDDARHGNPGCMFEFHEQHIIHRVLGYADRFVGSSGAGAA